MNSRSLGPPLSVSSPRCNHIVRCDALEFDSFTLCIDDLHLMMISISTNHAVRHGPSMILILHHLLENTLHKHTSFKLYTQDILPDFSLTLFLSTYKQKRARTHAQKRALLLCLIKDNCRGCYALAEISAGCYAMAEMYKIYSSYSSWLQVPIMSAKIVGS